MRPELWNPRAPHATTVNSQASLDYTFENLDRFAKWRIRWICLWAPCYSPEWDSAASRPTANGYAWAHGGELPQLIDQAHRRGVGVVGYVHPWKWDEQGLIYTELQANVDALEVDGVFVDGGFKYDPTLGRIAAFCEWLKRNGCLVWLHWSVHPGMGRQDWLHPLLAENIHYAQWGESNVPPATWNAWRVLDCGVPCNYKPPTSPLNLKVIGDQMRENPKGWLEESAHWGGLWRGYMHRENHREAYLEYFLPAWEASR